MRIQWLEDTLTRSGIVPAGTEESVQPDVGARRIAEGRAAEVLEDGSIRRRRGRPLGSATKGAKRIARKLATLGGAGSGPGSEPEPAPPSDFAALELSPDARG